MIEISFIIKGNHKDPAGNPFPKLKMTGKQHWTAKAREYVKWKEHVVAALIDEISRINKRAAQDAARNYAALKKPLVLGNRYAEMHIRIKWKNGAHGDPENIFGSIADALFYNDKNLYGSFLPAEEGEIDSVGAAVAVIIKVSETS